VSEEQKIVLSENEVLKIYFTVHSHVKAMDFDGGGMNIASREYILNAESLWYKAISYPVE
jgi:hypothetical protein